MSISLPIDLIINDNGMKKKHIAVIMKNGIPISHYKTNYHITDDMTDEINSIHAEINTVFGFLHLSRKSMRLFNNVDNMNISYRKRCSGLDICVIRIKKNGHLSNSKPCDNCQRILKKLGFRNVIYSTGNMDLEFEVLRI
jgi:hypothetical protein